MRHDEVNENLRRLTFDFFFWFSRFKYTLKEARFLRSTQISIPAEPSWKKFCQKYRDTYQPGPAARALLDADPARRVIVANGALGFAPVVFNPGVADLDEVAELARTVRNTLFHGGKHGIEFWDDPGRMELLLATTIAVLDELAEFSGLRGDYRREY